MNILTSFGGRGPISLQSKFLLGLAIILFFFSAFAASLIYVYEKNSIEEEAFQKTEVLMAAVGATRNYVRGVLRPRMYDVLGEEAFVMEAMSSSYVSRAVMDIFKEELPDFEYRRVGLGARNPAFEANEQERQMIDYFRQNSAARDWQGIVKTGERRYFMRYQPVTFLESCLRCHGLPHEAPASITRIYGEEHGFFKEPGQVHGLVSVGIPVDTGFAKTREIAFSVFSIVFLSVFFLFGIITFFFNRLIVQNLQEVLGIFRDSFADDTSAEFQQDLESRDEIGDLKIAARGMAGHLKEARDRLHDYTENLEQKVEARTGALRQSEQLLREKVEARNRELKSLNTIAEQMTTSTELAAILPNVLDQALAILPAAGAAIYLVNESRDRLLLQCRKNAPQLAASLPINLKDVLDEPADQTASLCDAAFGRMNFFEEQGGDFNTLNLPLCCRDQILGVMTFVETGFGEISAELQTLLFSIGHQVGIAIESLQNMERLLASKELLQAVFDGITDMVVLVDGDGRFRMVNTAFLEFYNLGLGQVIHRRVEELEHEAPHPFVCCQEILDEGEPGSRSIQVHKGGDIFQAHFYPVFDEHRFIKHIICYAKEVTEQKRIEQRMQQTEKLLSLGRMAAGVAHEINNPLGVILCYTDILKEDLTGSLQSLEDLAVIEKHARGCQKIVADLLDFARTRQTVKKEGQLNPLVEEVVNVVRTQFRKEKIDLLLELADQLPPLLLDSDKIKQVIMNLLVNAAQAMEGHGEVAVFTFFHKELNRVQLIVEDNGCGIPEEIMGRIFDPFFTSKEPGRGTGLGLSLAFGIIRDHDGDIQVESEPGHWTRFTVTLPVPEATKGERE